MFVGQSYEFPNMQDYGMTVQPGHEHFFSISNTILNANNEIQKIAPEKRECYFADEGNLEYYQIYTFSNCLLECLMKKALDQLGCIPWYLPQGQNSTLCDPWTARNFSTMMSSLEMDDKCSHCLPDCERNSYHITPTSDECRSFANFYVYFIFTP